MDKKTTQFVQFLEIKRYSISSIKTYTNSFRQFLNHFSGQDVDTLTTKQIETFINHQVTQNNISITYQKQLVAAIKFWYNGVLGKKIELNYLYPDRSEFKLPKVLSQQEIKTIIATTENLKHKAILATIYACGLRVSELTNLKIQDINSQTMTITILKAKGNRDRIVVLSDKLLVILREYFLQYKPKTYLFEGIKNNKYTVRSVQQLFKKALTQAQINQHYTVHSLRHSYATHLIEQGIDIRFVQDLLGHKNINTTMIYTHLTDSSKRKIKSPLDNLS